MFIRIKTATATGGKRTPALKGRSAELNAVVGFVSIVPIVEKATLGDSQRVKPVVNVGIAVVVVVVVLVSPNPIIMRCLPVENLENFPCLNATLT